MPQLSAALPLQAGTSHSQQSGGSTQSSVNTSSGRSVSQSQTNGTEATAAAVNAATIAYERQKELNEAQMRFNAEEALKQREWEEKMANTIYTRSVANMKEAGINPILAANMGLSGASVGSGATASMGGSSAPMANTFANSSAQSLSESSGYGESHGSSWQQGTSDSLYGMQESLNQAKNVVTSVLDTINNSRLMDEIMKGLGVSGKTRETGSAIEVGKEVIKNLPVTLAKGFKHVDDQQKGKRSSNEVKKGYDFRWKGNAH